MTATVIEFAGRSSAAPIVHLDEFAAERRAKRRTTREERNKQWRDAEIRLDFLNALGRLGHYAYIAARDQGLREAKQYLHLEDQRPELGDRIRRAEVELIFTPAPTRAAVNWKLALRRTDRLKYVGVTLEAFEKQIAEDEAYLAANAPRRRKQAAAANDADGGTQ